MAKYKLEYIWLDGYEPVRNLRSKTQLKDFDSFPKLIDSMGGVTYKGSCVVSKINGGYKNGGYTLRLKSGRTHIDGKQALALARTRKNLCNPRENDLARVQRQQKILNAMKWRMLSPGAFVRLPWIAWQAPQTLRTDMSGPTQLGLFGGMMIGGGSNNIQKNIIGERGLDLPREPKVQGTVAIGRG